MYRNVFWIVAAALYVDSAVFYHIAWEGSPVHPSTSDIWET